MKKIPVMLSEQLTDALKENGIKGETYEVIIWRLLKGEGKKKK